MGNREEVLFRFLDDKQQKFYSSDDVYYHNGTNYFYNEEEYEETDPRFYEEDEEVLGDWFKDTGFNDKENNVVWDLDIIFYENEYYTVQEDYEAKGLCFRFHRFPTAIFKNDKGKIFTKEIANNSIVVGNGLIVKDIDNVLSKLQEVGQA